MLGSVLIETEALSVSVSTGTVMLPGTSPVISLSVGFNKVSVPPDGICPGACGGGLGRGKSLNSGG